MSNDRDKLSLIDRVSREIDEQVLSGEPTVPEAPPQYSADEASAWSNGYLAGYETADESHGNLLNMIEVNARAELNATSIMLKQTRAELAMVYEALRIAGLPQPADPEKYKADLKASIEKTLIKLLNERFGEKKNDAG